MKNVEKMTIDEIEDEFYRLIEIMANQGDIDVICGLIEEDTKKQFIKEWHKDRRI